MDITAVLNLLFYGNQLKRTARTGWTMRGVVNAENVAAHSYGVVFATLVLAEVVDAPVDLGKALAMAALHDLPEALTTDLPTPSQRYLPPGLKQDMEHGALSDMMDGASFGPALLALWEELAANITVEARLVHDADRLDLFVQAVVYEEQSGNRTLAEFWRTRPTFHFPQSEAVYEMLRARRDRVNSGD